MNYAVQGKSYPAYSRDEICEQVPSLRRRFTSYKQYADATLADCFDEQQLKQARRHSINEVRTLVLENTGRDLTPRRLPLLAQNAPVYAMLADDFDRNGTRDLLLLGNNSTMRLRIGKVDANIGTVLLNRGNWRFEPAAPEQTGLLLRGDVRDVKRAGPFVFVGINNDNLRVFRTGD